MRNCINWFPVNLIRNFEEELKSIQKRWEIIKNRKFNLIILIFAVILIIAGCVQANNPAGNDLEAEATEETTVTETIDEYSSYTDSYDVAEYIHTYNKLPQNFITKNEAMDLGWKSEEGNLWDVTEKMSIGGDRFGNREGLLPKKEGRIYYECDVNYEGGYRGAERIVYSNDGLIFYTDDHYKSFTQLY